MLNCDGFFLHIQKVAHRSLVVALSGGVDSVVLLHLCLQLKRSGKIKNLSAFHVNHNLSPNVGQWQAFCEQLCAQWDIPLRQANVDTFGYIASHQGKKHSSESAARFLRYQVFKRDLSSEHCLLMAHHKNDQCETLLYRILRGTGIRGLVGMPKQRKLGGSYLCRPLLGFNRKTIEQYAKQHHLQWITDECNFNVAYDRNYLRHTIAPLLEARWPQFADALFRLSTIAADNDELAGEIAKADLAQLTINEDLDTLQPKGLSLSGIQKFSAPRQRNVLRFWLACRQKPLILSYQIIEEIRSKLLLSKSVSGFVAVSKSGVSIRRCGDRLVCIKQTSLYKLNSKLAYTEQLRTALSCDEKTLTLSLDNNGIVTIDLAQLKKIATAPEGHWWHSLQLSYRHEIALAPFSIPGRTGSKPLKKWLHEFRVPIWLRQNFPLIHSENQLIIAPCGMINAKYLSGSSKPFVMLWRIES